MSESHHPRRRLHRQHALQGPGGPRDRLHSAAAFVPPTARGSVRGYCPGGGVEGENFGPLGLPILVTGLGLSWSPGPQLLMKGPFAPYASHLHGPSPCWVSPFGYIMSKQVFLISNLSKLLTYSCFYLFIIYSYFYLILSSPI